MTKQRTSVSRARQTSKPSATDASPATAFRWRFAGGLGRTRAVPVRAPDADRRSTTVRHQQLLLRPTEVAEMLGLSRSKIFELLAAGELPVVRIGRATRVAREELERWVAEQTSWQPRAGQGLLHRLQQRIEAKSP